MDNRYVGSSCNDNTPPLSHLHCCLWDCADSYLWPHIRKPLDTLKIDQVSGRFVFFFGGTFRSTEEDEAVRRERETREPGIVRGFLS